MRLPFSVSVAMASLVVTFSLHAGNLVDLAPACTTNTFAFYETLNSEHQCSVGILNFDGFGLTDSQTGGATLLTAAQIKVTPLAKGGTGGGFALSAEDPVGTPFAVGANQTASYVLSWFFQIDPGPVSGSADLGMDPPFGNVTITQSYCGDGGTDGPNYCSTGFQSLTVSSPPCVDPVLHPETCNTTKIFDRPIQNFAEVITRITLTGSANGGAGFDSQTGDSAVTVAPEPATLLLAFALLGGLLGVSRFRMRKS